MSGRRLESVIVTDLKKKMVMLGGPRQCGKTTLAKTVAKALHQSHSYYNWDIDVDRRTILKGEIEATSHLWILDELHKYKRWRNWLKGLFDQHHPDHSFLITGSAKLETFSRGGDSLQGRYFLHRLHPFTLAELLHPHKMSSWQDIPNCPLSVPGSVKKTLLDLLVLGGFPEPYFSQSQKEASRWRLAYGGRIVRDEIRSLEQVQNLDGMEILFDRLSSTVGSPLSLNSLREDLQVAFETVRNWVGIFERLYAVFRIAPFGAPRIRALKKEQKLYFWDWARVEDDAARLENLVAVHLICFVHWQEDVEGEKWELRTFRDKQGHEVDFILLRKGQPFCAIEVKSSDRPLDPNLQYLLQRVKIPYAFQISLGDKDFMPAPINSCKIRIMPAYRFLAQWV